ncbi:hypothetical protein PFICI_11188 [Pestalotiopsis fici W106-1]|uniref:Uncharacterized protein n=1 Tax=Pestalotiopsis fici (strain W106-1 / CGMCC3.15140) TaxID=1229662 RepID=W3WU49_PESFW|nr:uncharacterized protein PFICI_11188 [Pestalotiopsis fici W106-1]ETS77314.1 hypothetical protein PFICI_11188 [Pestalotiopsis fici W106-1]
MSNRTNPTAKPPPLGRNAIAKTKPTLDPSRSPANPIQPVPPAAVLTGRPPPAKRKDEDKTGTMTFEVEIEFIAFCREAPAYDATKDKECPYVLIPGTQIRIPKSSLTGFRGAPYTLPTRHRALVPGQPFEDLGLDPDNPNYIPIRRGGGAMDGFDEMLKDLESRRVDIVHGGPRTRLPPGMPEIKDPNLPRFAANTDNRLHHHWVLEYNPSAALDKEDAHMATGEIHALPLRLTTPAMTRRNGDWAELFTVWNLVKKHYRIHINDSCGINVNVGLPKKRFSADELRDVARLCWATEGIMLQIHGPQRYQRNAFPLRRWSALGRGMTAENFGDDQKTEFTPRRGITLLEGDAELKKCTTEAQVSGLLQHSAKQLSFDFKNYHPDYLQSQELANLVVDHTIQFRQAGASINGEWIAHWTNICVRSLEWLFEDENRSRLDTIADGCLLGENGSEQDAVDVLKDFLKVTGCGEQSEYLLRTDLEFRTYGGTPTLTPNPDSATVAAPSGPTS